MLGRRHAGTALAVLALWGCNAGPNNGPAASSSGSPSAPPSGPIAPPLIGSPSSGSATGGSTTGGATTGGATSSGAGPTIIVIPIGPSTGAAGGGGASSGSTAPASAQWMTEDEEVAWMNAIGFNVTLADLRASYARFTPKPVDPTTNVLWGTESDDLRNWYRLAKRTNDAAFLQQAQSWHDFMVGTYSNWQQGGNNVVEPEHVYMMGLVDWYVDHKDAATLAAIDRIIDFVKTISPDPFFETRVSARCLLCLSYYMEKIGTRAAEVTPMIQAFIHGIESAPVESGLTVMKFAVGTDMSIDNLPAGIDVTQRFPQDAAAGLVSVGTTSASPYVYNLKGFEGAGTYQDCMLMHALHVAARVEKDPSLDSIADRIAAAWVPHVAAPFWDATGQYALTVPYYLLPGAPETDVFHFPGASTPLYVTQYAAFCPDAALRKKLSQQALLRQWGELDGVRSIELGGQPRYWLWETWEQGYFLTQK